MTTPTRDWVLDGCIALLCLALFTLSGALLGGWTGARIEEASRCVEIRR
jgi:hypothetical protein